MLDRRHVEVLAGCRGGCSAGSEKVPGNDVVLVKRRTRFGDIATACHAFGHKRVFVFHRSRPLTQ
jgi:hypothetical protein